MTPLENAMAVLMQTFDQYSSSEGSKGTLTQGELKTMLKAELPGLLKCAKDQGKVDELLQSMDLNHDKEMDFEEFIVVVGTMTCACHGRHQKR